MIGKTLAFIENRQRVDKASRQSKILLAGLRKEKLNCKVITQIYF